MAGDIVVASLKGEDVSVTEKAQARLGELFKVEKDGELITGTPVQAKVAKTEKLLNDGNVESAIAELEKLDGPEAELVKPWIAKAQQTLTAQKLEQALTQAVSGNLGGGRLFIDEESGVELYKPAPQFKAPKMLQTEQ